ncbi:MAG: glycosyltransferase family 2 protein, partial [Lachnospiraceae bacterium]|nr:glycosyltransferase family 2 protein [Lachnospiraceae bacterium]
LETAYESLSPGAELFIVRNKDAFDFHKDSIRLIQAGFEQIAPLKENRDASNRKDLVTLRCKKGEKREKLLSIVIPVFNEEATVRTLLDSLVEKKWPMPVEFVIVESNSSDATREIVKTYGKYDNVTLVFEDQPAGKGNGVLNGIRHASGTHIAIQDGDLEYDVNDYDKLLAPLIADETLFVLGSRYNKDDWHMRKFSGKRAWLADYLNLGQTLLTWLLNTACGSKLSDPITMNMIFHRECMYGINFIGGNFGLDWELVIRFLRKGYTPIERPISYKARSYEEGKHIALLKTPLEGLRMLWHCRFASRVYDYGNE